jgi:hypothetical protein
MKIKKIASKIVRNELDGDQESPVEMKHETASNCGKEMPVKDMMKHAKKLGCKLKAC